MHWKLLTEVNDLEQIISHCSTRLAVGQVTLDSNLLAQLEPAVNVLR
jgi:hypothetical protein